MARSFPLHEQALEIVARRFAVLAEPMRLRLIQALFDGEKNVTELVAATGGSQANVSRHLQTLLGVDILARRKEGLQVIYRINDPNIPKLCQLVCGGLEKSLSKQAAHFAPAD
ncbi:MAG TPA: metalloregulator ArsR/SmtB family transcription factor [Lacunisphaera sp.]|jgi:ArsR family transcriptional regulator|nr:metalloregulator ArsR/SmtB family transcription factor [Lacunisphaera sp.]